MSKESTVAAKETIRSKEIAMEGLSRKQDDLLDRLHSSYSTYKKSSKERITTSYIKARLDIIDTMWESFTNTHSEIVANCSKTEKTKLVYFTEDVYSSFENIYLDYKTRLCDDMETLKNTNPKSLTLPGKEIDTCFEVKLPQIHLPKFSSGYEEWQTFHDMFESLIHNNANLSAVQKLHYLKGCLSGEAENLIKNLSTTDMNYTEAWSQLTQRYSNKRYNCNEVMKRLFSQKTICVESANSIKQLLDTTLSCLKSLVNLGIKTESWDAIINHLVLSKLDQETRKQWENQVSQLESDELPTWSQLKRFLETRFRTLEILDGGKSVSRYAQNNTNVAPNFKFVSKAKSYHTTFDENKQMSSYACVMCLGKHALYQCKQYANQTPQERAEYIQSKGLCFNCLSSNHTVKSCHRSACCRRCGRRHHTTLHFERRPFQESNNAVCENKESNQSSTSKEQPRQEFETKVVAHFTKESQLSRVLLATAKVKITSPNGYFLIVRALIDQGSETSFVSEDIVQSLALKRVSVNGVVSGVGEGVTRTKSMVSFKLESLHNSNFSTPVNAYVLNNLTSFLPSQNTSITSWRDVENLPLADPDYGKPAKIDVILGAEIYGEIIVEGLLKHPSSYGPIAQNTYLGWILSGKVTDQLPSKNAHLLSLHVQLKGDDLLKQFWEIEREPEPIEKKKTEKEMRCERIFEKTTIRDEKGPYIVRLPFKVAYPECLKGRTREIALRRFKMLERKLLKNPVLHSEYSKVMQDFIEQNHMEKITDINEINDPSVVYLPHHAIIREDKETTKIRPVFDASCKGINNVSLNDELLVGPKLQQDLRHILMRWRCHRVCIVADLVKMYRQILVDRRDTDFQRIFWRSDPKQPIESYRLLRLTFGTACAPYLAVKCLQQLAKDEAKNYPIASEITLKDYYMDDLLTGCETDDQALEIYDEMNKLMNAGGFQLQKWCTNSPKLLKFIKESNQRIDSTVVLKSSDTTKVLGILWNKITDKFEYTFKPTESTGSVTKRKVLSDIARIYDPMGWIAPIVITAKIFIQKLWKAGLSWDDQLTSELLQEWLLFKEDLSQVQNIVIPRWLNIRKGDHIELHAFADASQAAYAAAVYIKARDKKGYVSVNLVTAKTKVAPVEKEISIPRMELCAAVLAAKLVHEVAQVMDIPKNNIFAWTDSTIVLAWIAKEPSYWTVFVSNRVSEILTILNRDQWSHVSTHENPADCASRGVSFKNLIDHKLWWHGPDWLHEKHCKITFTNFETTEEERRVKSLTVVIKPEEDFIWCKFSNLGRMLRVLSYCKRFLNLRLKKEQRKTYSKAMTSEEIEGTLSKCIEETQSFHFEEEIKQIKSNGAVFKRSVLHTLCPIFDENGIMRVGGRIHEAQIEFDKKHPIIMPAESHLTKLIINNAHLKTLHGGPQIMLNYLRSKYWIIRGRHLVKKCYRSCTVCIRYSHQNNNPLMGRLPQDRVTPTRAFKITGVDFTGFINVRFAPGRGSRSYKAYICLFVCMFSKAVHLEPVLDMSSQGFIAAFRRFVSRRGHCQILHSDNGTNFVGADKELKNMFNRAKSQMPDEIQHLLANDGTTWKFIPPHAPNFGGLWEAGVRSTKTHLKRVVGTSTLTLEELFTVLTQIEACLNSRPLSYLSDYINDPTPLTPGHFLVGEPLIVIPDTSCDEKNVTGIQRWKMTQKMVNDFWKKWSTEYLVTLNQRYKWYSNKSEPNLNDVVIIKDHNLPPAKWLLGRIIDKHAGKDNITRVVSIKTKTGVCKRPCNKLCFLPCST